MTHKALICGVSGHDLSRAERDFIARHNPWGFILFGRNVDTPTQVAKLIHQLQETADRPNLPVFIDQEGGRVQRLRPPHWYHYPAAARLGGIYNHNQAEGLRATWLVSRLHAFDLLALGITSDCLPVIDIPSPDGHDVIGDRAYGNTVEAVTKLGQAACEGLMAGGVQPVIKHIPGHGRATADSHHALPVVETQRAELNETDFAPFKAMSAIAMAMTAHVIYRDIDPNQPATTSPIIINEIIRDFMGYDGLLMCDDITMGALSGDLATRTRATFSAGCDIVLHCTGVMEEMEEVASATMLLEGKAAMRAERAFAEMGKADECDEKDCRAELKDILARYDSIQLAAGQDPTNYGRT